jgi:DNA-binding LytR/AlgR family response regulator
MIRCVIVEDEPLALDRVAEYVARMPQLDLAGSFDNAADAIAFLRQDPVDLVFLDVRLGGASGIDLLAAGAIRGKVILTTAHEEYAIKAYDLEVVDYLLKPYTFERFARAVQRVQALTGPDASGARDYIFVKTELRLERIRLDDVILIEGQRDYRRIHTAGKRIMTLETFTALERRIAPDVVCRIHKSYMVALDKVESVEGGRVTIGGRTLPVSDTYRERFLSLLRR